VDSDSYINPHFTPCQMDFLSANWVLTGREFRAVLVKQQGVRPAWA
jgi:hypothetical protein